jgi:hypothetical protein
VADMAHNIANKTTETPSFSNGWPYRFRYCERIVRRDMSVSLLSTTLDHFHAPPYLDELLVQMALNFSISTSKIHLTEVPSLNHDHPCMKRINQEAGRDLLYLHPRPFIGTGAKNRPPTRWWRRVGVGCFIRLLVCFVP